MVIDKKTEILKAAGECFSRFGYDKTTLDDIGAIVGLNKASLYYYYKNKETIFTEVIFLEAEEFLERLKNKVENEKGCKNKILKYVVERFRYIIAADNLNQISVETIQSIKPMFDELYGKILEKEADLIKSVLVKCAQNHEIIRCDHQKVAKSILVVMEAIKNNSPLCRTKTRVKLPDYSAVEEELIFTVSLILDGIIKNKGGEK